MIQGMKKVVTALKVRVAQNLEEISKNEKQFKLLMSQGKAESMALELNTLLDRNKYLLEENFDFINVQLAMLKFIELHKRQNVIQNNDGTVSDETATNNSESDIFENTIKGHIHFSPEHPMFYNDNFYARLMDHYAINDKPEMCTKILKIRVWGNVN